MEARALAIRYLHGEANDQEVAALDAWLLQSPANALLLAECAVDEQNFPSAAREVLDQVEGLERDTQITADLFASLLPSDDLEPVDITEAVLAQERERLEAIAREQAEQEAAKREASWFNSPHVVVIPRPVVWLASAAMIGMLAWLGSMLLSNGTDPENMAKAPIEPAIVPLKVAAVLSNSDAVWEDPATAQAGLSVGQHVRLLSGVAEIKFNRGAVVLVQGPALVTPVSDNALVLNEGQLFAEIPPSAVGFEVDTRFGLIRDFGTEFGVAVDPWAGLQAHVFKGEIGVMARDASNKLGEMTKLHDNEAAEIAVGEEAVALVQEPFASRYVRRDEFDLLTIKNPSPAERWRAHLYRLEREKNLIANLGFSDGQMQVKQGPAGQSFEARWVGGKVVPAKGSSVGTQAMRLDAVAEQGIDIDVADHAGYDKLTFVAWARIEPEPNRSNIPLLHHVRLDTPISTPNWQLRPDLDAIHINQFSGIGAAKSSKRIAASVQGIVWEQWHCFVAVIDARSGICDHYFDGVWIGSGEIEQKVPLRLEGLRIGSSGSVVTPDNHHRAIKGEIAQMMFLNTTLDAEEVRRIYEASRPLFH